MKINHAACYIKDYPRPQLVRSEWQSLNGEWNFRFDDTDEGEKNGWQNGFIGDKIVVPFSYESQKSGIADERAHSCVWYSREVVIDTDKKTAINFEGSDYCTKVWVNGCFAGENKGAYHRFTLTDAAFKKGKNMVTVKVTDDFSCDRPRGKQRWEKENFGCWYVQTTGIFKSVWLEFLGEAFIKHIKITPCLDEYTARFDCAVEGNSQALTLETDVFFKGRKVKSTIINVLEKTETFSVVLDSMQVNFKSELWSPENPHLYDVSFTLKKQGKIIDEAKSYFGLRDIRTENGNIIFNRSPVMMKMILDQGYWQDSHLTPPDEQAIIDDVLLIKEMGFNGVRKHQKIEDDRFYYYADVLGLFVWCEMPSSYWFSDNAVRSFTDEWQSVVTDHYNHPSIVAWVPFNESWGIPTVAYTAAQQNFTKAAYYLTKTLDPYRLVISNDGWEHTFSDILTIHNYEQSGEVMKKIFRDLQATVTGGVGVPRLPFAKGHEYSGQPIIFSEYGGASFTKDSKKGWGYGNSVVTEEDFINRYRELTNAFKQLPFCAGYCYTQLTDVQQEVNGILYIDRKPKVPLNKIKQINDEK